MNKKALIFLIFIVTIAFAFRPKQDSPIHLIFIGDSITEARGIKGPQNPPASAASYLTARGFKNVEFRNQGRSGFTTVDFLPATKKAYSKVIEAANSFSDKENAILVFSIMLGTNDSAVKGPNGAPVAKENYHKNLKILTDSLIARFPKCKIIFNNPVWYSDSTRNTSTYFVEGRERLQSYMPEIAALVKQYKKTKPATLFLGDKKAYGYFKKNYLTDMKTETGPSGVYYLHPNPKGSEALGKLWGAAIEKMLNR